MTQCCMEALYAGGKDIQKVTNLAKTFERRRCNHRTAIAPDECLTDVIGESNDSSLLCINPCGAEETSEVTVVTKVERSLSVPPSDHYSLTATCHWQRRSIILHSVYPLLNTANLQARQTNTATSWPPNPPPSSLPSPASPACPSFTSTHAACSSFHHLAQRRSEPRIPSRKDGD